MHFSEARWRAAGVRHEILLRMWPLQQHDMRAALASLRCWDGHPGDSAEAAQALPVCLALAGHALSLRGHRLAAPTVASGRDPVRMPDFTYAVLAHHGAGLPPRAPAGAVAAVDRAAAAAMARR